MRVMPCAPRAATIVATSGVWNRKLEQMRTLNGINRSAICWAAMAGMLAASIAMAQAAPRPQIGDKLGHVLVYRYSLLAALVERLCEPQKTRCRKRAFVMVFTNTTCPIVQRFLPRLEAVGQRISRCKACSSWPSMSGQTTRCSKSPRRRLSTTCHFRSLKISTAVAWRPAASTEPPTAVLIDSDYKIRYRGRIDNSFRLGGTTPGAVSTELRDAIRSLLGWRRNRRHRNAGGWLPDHQGVDGPATPTTY